MLPGASEKVDSAARASGIKDAMVVPIINHITAKGKALRSKKSPNDSTSQDADEITMEDGLTQVGPDLMDVDENCIDEPVWSAFGNITCTDAITGSGSRGRSARLGHGYRPEARAAGEHITPGEQ